VAGARTYSTSFVVDSKGRVHVPVPFDPDEAWGAKKEHRIGGTVAGMAVRGSITSVEGGREFVLGPAWNRDCGSMLGGEVEVEIEPEGPQRSDLAPDVAAALESEPAAGEFFDSLAQFYRKAYLKWVDSTKRRPDLREARIAEMVTLLVAGKKERPKG